MKTSALLLGGAMMFAAPAHAAEDVFFCAIGAHDPGNICNVTLYNNMDECNAGLKLMYRASADRPEVSFSNNVMTFDDGPDGLTLSMFCTTHPLPNWKIIHLQ